MRARGVGQAAPRSRKAGGRPTAGSCPQQRSRPPKAEPAVQDDDMDDIEAILRKHGIQ